MDTATGFVACVSSRNTSKTALDISTESCQSTRRQMHKLSFYVFLVHQLAEFCALSDTTAVTSCTAVVNSFEEFGEVPAVGVNFTLTVVADVNQQLLFSDLVAAVENRRFDAVNEQRIWASTVELGDCESRTLHDVIKRYMVMSHMTSLFS